MVIFDTIFSRPFEGTLLRQNEFKKSPGNFFLKGSSRQRNTRIQQNTLGLGVD